MKANRLTVNHFTIMVIFILTLMLTGCGPRPVVEDTPEPPAVQQATIVQPTVAVVETEEVEEPEVAEPEVEPTAVVEDQPDDDDARMEDLLSEKVGTCHALSFVLRQNKTREEWSVTIDRMIGYGAPINAEEKELLINWLVSRN